MLYTRHSIPSHWFSVRAGIGVDIGVGVGVVGHKYRLQCVYTGMYIHIHMQEQSPAFTFMHASHGG